MRRRLTTAAAAAISSVLEESSTSASTSPETICSTKPGCGDVAGDANRGDGGVIADCELVAVRAIVLLAADLTKF
jgi:hypothetical protein